MRLAFFLVLLTVVASSACLGADVTAADPADVPQAQTAESTATSPEDSEAVALPAHEQGATDGEEETPEIEVEVVGKREGLLSISPAPGEQVSEVTAAEISNTAAHTVMDALDLTPSVFVRHQGARYENRLSIRGMTPRLVLLDGLPVAREGSSGPGGGAGGAESSFAGRILYTMPVEMIERIDVVRSANTIVYGPASAAGAVINIVTREPAAGTSKVAGNVEYGSFDRNRAALDAAVSDGHIGFFVLADAEHAESHLPLGEKRFSDVFGKLFFNYPDGSKLLIDVFSLEGRRTLDLSQDFTIVPARYWRIDPWKEQFANLVYSRALSQDDTLDFVLYRRNRDFTTSQYTNATFNAVNTNWLEGQDDAGVDLRYSRRREDGRMTRFGFQWYDLTSDTLQTQYIGPSGPLPKPKVTSVSQDRNGWGSFANHTWPLRANLRATVGARYDDLDSFSSDMTFSAGLEANVSPKTLWYMNVGTGAEHPEPTAGDVGAGIVPPEANSVSAETGWTLRPNESQSWTLALFWARTRDAQVLYNNPPGAIGPLAFLTKAEDLTTSGLEVTYNRRVSERVSWFANFTYLREDLANNNPPAIPGPRYPFAPKPPHNIGAAGLRADVGKTRVALSLKTASDHSEQSRLMKTAWPVSSYAVFDLKVSRALGRGEISLFVDNLLNADYETMPAFPRPGRNYLVSYRFPL